MRKSLKTVIAAGLAAALATGLAACDAFPPIEIPTQVPDISIPPLPTGEPAPGPTVTVTGEPAPAPTVTVTVTAEPEPRPTQTVTADPGPRPTATVTANPGDPVPVPTVTVAVTSTVTATPTPTATAAPSVTPSPSVTPTVTPSPDTPVEGDDDPTRWWPWILLGLVIAGLLAWWWSTAAARSNGKRRLNAARTQMAWADGTLAPHVLGQASAAEASAAWDEGKPRLAELDRELYKQSTSAPSQELRTAAAQGRVLLGELTAAMDADTAPDASDNADAVRARRARIEAARTQVRAWMAAGDR